MPVLDIIDGNNWLNRAFYSAPQLTSETGVATGALKVFISMVDSLIGFRMSKNQECYLAVVFDVPTKTTIRSKDFQKFLSASSSVIEEMREAKVLPPKAAENLLKGYKGTRDPNKDKKASLHDQMTLAIKALQLRGITVYRLAEYEADDVIGTLTRVPGAKKVIRSSDKDFAQLISNTVHLVRKTTEDPHARVRPSNCKEIYKVEPNQIIDYLAMRGDSEDNVPGIPGIGEIKASELLASYGTAAKMFCAASRGEIPGALGKKLNDKNVRKLFAFSRSMVELYLKVPGVSKDISDYKLKNIECYKGKLNKFAASLNMTKTFVR